MKKEFCLFEYFFNMSGYIGIASSGITESE
jgi:hypothetical protein